MHHKLVVTRQVGGIQDGNESTAPIVGGKIAKRSMTVHRSSPTHAAIYEFKRWVKDGGELVAEFVYVETRERREALDLICPSTCGLVDLPED